MTIWDRFLSALYRRGGVQNRIQGRALLCMLKNNIHDHLVYRIRLDELRRLVETLDIKVVGEVVQNRHHPYAKYCIGSGKVKEIRGLVEKDDLNLVIFYNIIGSSQKLNLIRAIGCDVVDRYEITLEIFDKMASDNLSKLQIQAARLNKLTPYFKLEANLRFHNDRPFFHGSGEYGFRSQLEELTRRQSRIREQIATLLKENQQRIRKRKSLGYPSICIAGYYNAGKTSLFNALTGESKPVSDQPFTTLSSKYQRRFIDQDTTLMFIDTIGFVIDLDPGLIKSFELNMEDMSSADLVILLLEITDPILTLRIKLAEGIKLLREIGVSIERIIVVFNKTDLAPELSGTIGQELGMDHLGLPWTAVSAKERANLDGLLHIILERLKELRQPIGQPLNQVKAETVGTR